METIQKSKSLIYFSKYENFSDKKPFRYRLPVSPPRKRTKISSSTPNLKSPSIRTPSLLKKSLSISKYLEM
jgi:hypothetical protein